MVWRSKRLGWLTGLSLALAVGLAWAGGRGLLAGLDRPVGCLGSSLTGYFNKSAPSAPVVVIRLENDAAGYGPWPWPERVWTRLARRIQSTGPKAVVWNLPPQAMSTTAPVPSPPAGVGNIGRWVLAVDGALATPDSALEAAMVEELSADLELPAPRLVERLLGRGIEGEQVPQAVSLGLDTARAKAMRRALAQRLGQDDRPWSEIAAELLPRASLLGSDCPLMLELARQRQIVEAERIVETWGLARPDSPAKLLTLGQTTPSPWRSSNQAESGDDTPRLWGVGVTAGAIAPPDDSAMPAGLPLWVRRGDRWLPQLGLAAACAAWNVPQADLTIDELASIMLVPRRGEPDRVVPLVTLPWPGMDQQAGACLLLACPAGIPQDDPPVISLGEIVQLLRHEDDAAEVARLAAETVEELRQALPRSARTSDLEPLAASNALDAAPRLAPWLTAANDWLAEQPAPAQGESRRPAAQRVADLSVRLDVAAHELTRLHDQHAQQLDWLGRELGGKLVFVADAPAHAGEHSGGIWLDVAVALSLLDGDYLRTAPPWLIWLATLLAGILGVALSLLRPRWLMALLVPLLMLAWLCLAYVYLQDQLGWFVRPTAPLACLLGVTVLGLMISTRPHDAYASAPLSLRSAGRVRESGSKAGHASAEEAPGWTPQSLLSVLGTAPEPAPRPRTVLYVGLAGVASLAEKQGPETVGLLREFRGAMLPIVAACRGHLGRFTPDGMLCLFGASGDDSRHAADAVAAFLQMQASMRNLAKRFSGKGLPAVSLLAGISSGPVTLGDAGTSDVADLTILGDPVRLAGQLQSANTHVGTTCLVSESTFAQTSSNVLHRQVGLLRLPGRISQLMAYEPLAAIGQATRWQQQCADLSRQIVQACQASRWADARTALGQYEAAFSQDGFWKLYTKMIDAAAKPT
ncbi:MAG: adenylate/guanylate cyclase domain-containing protein [Phycisphaeraceae bacterium]|nr:adenylate/guanylate cyclase domain-containing protein [Phycisphaeraceae bacterium]